MITRREFLKLSGGYAAAVLIIPSGAHSFPPDDEPRQATRKVRVAAQVVYRYSQPSFQSERTGNLRRDQVLTILEEIDSPEGPAYNPRWYRLFDGYAHSGRLQRVDGAKPNPHILENIPESGQLGEICMPYTQSFRYQRIGGWSRLYRLYFQSVHWITGIEPGPDGLPWYRLTDDLLHVHHFVPAPHVRPIAPAEITPLSPGLRPDQKRISVSIEEQSLTAFEDERQVFKAKVSTGIPSDPQPGLLPTETPRGRFYVQTKMPSRHMGEGNLTNDIEAYELPGVPWVSFFTKDGIAFHGTYWHDNFGRMMSHGCVNLRNADALWIYRWTTPVIAAHEWYARELGTVVDIE